MVTGFSNKTEEVVKALGEQKILSEQAEDKNKEFIKNSGKKQETTEAQSWNIVDAEGYKNSVIIEKTKENGYYISLIVNHKKRCS